MASSDPSVRARLGSVGRPLPGLTLSVRGANGEELGAGEAGEIWVTGAQVSGEYVGAERSGDGWFATRDSGHVDPAGYLYLHGRLDDVIVRGGENLAPGEIEAVLLDHGAVAAAAVVGIPDAEWGERVVAAVVLHDAGSATEDELRAFVGRRLRSTQTPERVQIRDELPYSETGKLLRRVLRELLGAEFGATPPSS
jgi:acyl-CoA synthetase (AMP-forming)/AMP-acid ligase II